MFKENSFSLKKISLFFTSISIFAPILFLDKMIDVFAMGVSMHYMQYIALTYIIFKRKNIKSKDNLNFKSYSVSYYLIFLLIYAVSMVYMSGLNINYKGENVGLYLIPVVFQLFHFYLDMFFWKFSKLHTRTNLSPYLFRKN